MFILFGIVIGIVVIATCSMVGKEIGEAVYDSLKSEEKTHKCC